MKRTLPVATALLFLATLNVRADNASKITGWISDSMCGAKHAGSGADCVKKCIQNGMKPVFVDDAKKEVWAIDNPDSVKGFYGDHVIVTATVDSAHKTVHVDSITGAK